MKRDKIKNLIKQVLEFEKNIEFAYIFGSFIDQERFNDIDIGVYMKEGEANFLEISFNLKEKILKALEKQKILISADKIDITIINSADLILIRDIFEKGVLIVDKNPEFRKDFIEKISLKLRECEGLFLEYVIR
jgi:hypothetical protein